MGDPGYFFETMKNQSRTARDAALGALSEAAKQERDRRALAKQFYERQALWDSGICPDCMEMQSHCSCEIPFSDAKDVQE